LVRGAQRDLHLARVHRRRDQPFDAAAICGFGVSVRLLPDLPPLFGSVRQTGGTDSDKHNIFRVNNKDPAGGDGIRQFGRALSELNIDIICANSPQAKGRIERAFATLQDRMVKELRLAGIVALTKSRIACFAGPSFYEASGTDVWAFVSVDLSVAAVATIADAASSIDRRSTLT
jgi:hypothetical protein